MRIQDVRDALLTVLPGRVYHFTAPTEAADGREPYAVWGETSLGTAYGDDAPADIAIAGLQAASAAIADINENAIAAVPVADDRVSLRAEPRAITSVILR